MDILTFQTHHLVKHDDLNHHGTLYAGRCADWVVEAGFTAAASLTKPEHIVCLKIHDLLFNEPARLGDLLRFESKVVYAGRSSLISFIRILRNGQSILEAFITFIHVDRDGKPVLHGITITPTLPEDIALHEQAGRLHGNKIS